MIRPTPITVDGRTGTLVFLDAAMVPVDANDPQAVIARAIFDDGSSSVYRVKPRVEHNLADWNAELHPRDEAGKFTESGGGEKPRGIYDAQKRLKALSNTVHISPEGGQPVASAAHITADVLEEMKAKGYKLPDTIAIFAAQQTSPSALVRGTQIVRDKDVPQRFGPLKTHRLDLEVNIPDSLPATANLDDVVKVAFDKKSDVIPKYAFNDDKFEHYDKFSVRTMRDVVVHEMAHANWKHVGRWDMGEIIGDEFRTNDSVWRAVYRVSEYGKHSPDEFIAEAFLRLYRGEKLADDSLALYRRLNGPEILK